MTFTNDDEGRIFAATKKKLDEIFDDERRIIKKLVWSLYEDYGLSPKLLRSAFQSVIWTLRPAKPEDMKKKARCFHPGELGRK